MYEFVYRILFCDGTTRIVDDIYLATICKEQADKIRIIRRIEVHYLDWLEVTAPTMRRILEGIEARHVTTGNSAS